MKKTCIITGANSEIGMSIAESLYGSHSLILTWHKNNGRIVEFTKTRFDVVVYQYDLRIEQNSISLMENVAREFGHTNLLINCIGKNNYNDNIDETILREVVESNLNPVFFLCKHYHKSMLSDLPGCIITFASTAGIRAIPSSPHYIAAKAGVIALTAYYANVLAPNIRVNAIAPGFVETEKHKSGKYKEIKNKIPLKRMASLAEIVKTVNYIIECEYLTGQTIVIDGGLVL